MRVRRLTSKEAEKRFPDLVKGQTWEGSKNKYWFICKKNRKHRQYFQRYHCHHKGARCPLCARELASSRLSLSSRVAEKRFPDMVKNQRWSGTKNKYWFKCKTHGRYLQKYSDHNAGKRCRLCRNAKLNLSIKQAEKTCPDMKKGQTWKSARTKYWFICSLHGQYRQDYNNHLQGNGCPQCGESRLEKETVRVLSLLGFSFERQERFEACRNFLPLPFDFALIGEKILIECQGLQHFQPVLRFGGRKGFKRLQRHDAIKRGWAKANGYELITIRYDENVEEILTTRFGVGLLKAA